MSEVKLALFAACIVLEFNDLRTIAKIFFFVLTKLMGVLFSVVSGASDNRPGESGMNRIG